MAKRPSCCLYLSFLIHFAAFASLLVGYSTPNWTLVKMSTGEVRLLGLVVTCDLKKCDTLHVTSARSVLVVIFGMYTFCILLSLFSIQIFCLALCNRSCKEKNIGTCLSYFSLFIAFCIGGTLGLYQIDLRDEDRPDVVDMWMGWSRYCIMGAAGGFFLGAWLNAADYCLRNRARNRELIKRTAEIKAKVASQAHPTQQGQTKNGNANMMNSVRHQNDSRKSSLAERRMQYANKDKWRTPIEKNRESVSPRMCNTVEHAIKNASKRGVSTRQGGDTRKDQRQRSTINNNVRGDGNKQNVDKRLVEIAKEHRVKSINVKEAPRISVTTGSAGGPNTRTNPSSENSNSAAAAAATASVARKAGKREERVEFSDAALKYRLEKLQQLTTPSTTNDERRKLSAVHEEDKGSPRASQTTPREKRVLSRQETKTLVGNNLSLLQTAASMNIDISSSINTRKPDRSERESKQLVKQVSVESKTSKTKSSDNPLPEINENNISRQTKPHPLQRDGQISSQENNNFGSRAKLRQTKTMSGSLDSNSNRMSRDEVIPPIKRESKTECGGKKQSEPVPATLPKADSKASTDNKVTTATMSMTSADNLDERIRNLQSQDSSTLSEDQIKRRQIVESILMAKKDRKKKRITQ